MENFPPILIGTGGIFLVVALIHFLANRLAVDFANKSGDLIRGEKRQPLVRPGFVLCLIGFFVAAYCLGQILSWWPPRWIELRQQKEEVRKRVKLAGGWSAVLEGGKIFFTSNDTPFFVFYPRRDTNINYPPAIAALKPREIEGQSDGKSGVLFLRIFGYHSTGSRGQGPYVLAINVGIQETNTQDYLLKRFQSRKVRQITNSIFEIY